MIIGSIAMQVAGYNPFAAYQALFVGSLFQAFDLGETIRTTTPLILTGLAVAIAFRTGLFNIGVEGQMIVAQLASLLVGIKLNLPPVLHMIVAVLVGGIAGAIWGFIPGFLKAVRGVNEVIICIMMNFIALYLSNVLVRNWLSEQGTDSTPKIPESASLRVDFLSEMFDSSRVHLGIIIALIMAFVMYILLWKTKRGYELRAVGYNPSAAEYAGINVKRNIILSMVISGFFAGLAGAGELLGTQGYMAIQSAFTGIGFDGIAVALLGANTPIGVILAALLFGVLTYGSQNMEHVAQVPPELIRVVVAAIIFFVAANISGILLGAVKKKRRAKES
ncbi:branched-chain amino acid ABC transporter permease [Thermoflavimicrobium daqui]|uniref:Branched-chain amino acid ABC transporter permease n=2 Tax=Thermoflavimicrobium daqui TaxID=2137476 RepID=A0A364K870_9BACL|nr:branched-chain amino acid ABC transporter permease [Thermoflavimicrobium daqui]